MTGLGGAAALARVGFRLTGTWPLARLQVRAPEVRHGKEIGPLALPQCMHSLLLLRLYLDRLCGVIVVRAAEFVCADRHRDSTSEEQSAIWEHPPSALVPPRTAWHDCLSLDTATLASCYLEAATLGACACWLAASTQQQGLRRRERTGAKQSLGGRGDSAVSAA